jgi:hypothetical protein
VHLYANMERRGVVVRTVEALPYVNMADKNADARIVVDHVSANMVRKRTDAKHAVAHLYATMVSSGTDAPIVMDLTYVNPGENPITLDAERWAIGSSAVSVVIVL